MTVETPEECWFSFAWYQLEEEGDKYLFKGGNGIWLLNLSNINHWETIWHQHDENIDGSARFQEKDELFVLRYSTGTASYTLLFDSNKQAYVGAARQKPWKNILSKRLSLQLRKISLRRRRVGILSGSLSTANKRKNRDKPRVVPLSADLWRTNNCCDDNCGGNK